MSDAQGSNAEPQQGAAANPWELPEASPMTLITLWPSASAGDDAPMQTEILAAIESRASSIAVVEELPSDAQDLAWGVVVETPAHPVPIMLWCERAQPLPPGELDDPAAHACQWAIGIETLLPAETPIDSFTELVRRLAAPFPSIPAILDVSSSRWLTRKALDRLFINDEVGPPTQIMWITHIVATDGAASECNEETAWLHTHGMWRFGLPELEMLDVPRQFVSSAATIINETAELLLEAPLPDPGRTLQIGDTLNLTLRRWQDVISRRPDDAMGSLADRTMDDTGDHIGPRAVLCSAEPGAGLEWPRHVVERVQRADGAIYRTTQTTERQARRARATWPSLAMAFASAPKNATPPDIASFIVKSGFIAGEAREHLWFDVQSIDGDAAKGALMNDPMSVTHLKRGDVATIDRSNVSDWVATIGQTSFGPLSAQELLETIDELKGAPTS